MLLTITNTRPPATDLGFLLTKHPDRVQDFSLPYGTAWVYYPEASEDRCTAALLLDVDPIGLVRGRKGSPSDGPLKQYVNDRPYVASSLLSTAIARVYRSAMAGTSKAKPELVAVPLPLEIGLPAVSCRGGERVLRALFEPLGYAVDCAHHPLPGGIDGGRVFSVTLRHELPLKEVLAHLYVLIPALDDDKHYWVGKDEIDKLLRIGEGWLATHPEQELISRRFLKHQRSLTKRALDRLREDEDPEDAAADAEEEAVERPMRLNETRYEAVADALAERIVTSVADLGCGEGKFLRRLSKDKGIQHIVGVDLSLRVLDVAARRLRLDRLSERQAARFELLHGSALYVDRRIADVDAITLVEVIEHLEPERIDALERVVFEATAPRCVVVTTPNIEHNQLFDGLPDGRLRHKDHRFEWTRAEFEAWARGVGERFGYDVAFATVGPVHEVHGPPTQLAAFDRRTA